MTYYLEFSGVYRRLKKSFFRFVRQLPFIKGKVQDEIAKSTQGMEKTFHKGAKDHAYQTQLPKKGLTEVKMIFELYHLVI